MSKYERVAGVMRIQFDIKAKSVRSVNPLGPGWKKSIYDNRKPANDS